MILETGNIFFLVMGWPNWIGRMASSKEGTMASLGLRSSRAHLLCMGGRETMSLGVVDGIMGCRWGWCSSYL